MRVLCEVRMQSIFEGHTQHLPMTNILRLIYPSGRPLILYSTRTYVHIFELVFVQKEELTYAFILHKLFCTEHQHTPLAARRRGA